MEPRDYLTRTTLQCEISTVRECQRVLWGLLEESRLRSLPAIPSVMDRYYRLPMPQLSADGDVVPGQVSAETHDLQKVLGARDARTTATLLTLESLVDGVFSRLEASSLSILQVRAAALVMLSGKGTVSRTTYFLTEARDERRPVVEATLLGQARINAGATEASVPVFSDRGVVGVVTATHSSQGALSGERLGWLAALAIELSPVLPPGGAVAPAHSP